MPYFSTRHPHGPRVDLKTVLLTGLASDGGLYMPDAIPTIAPAQVQRWGSAPNFVELASDVAVAWFGDEIPPETLHTICREAYDFAPVLCVVGDRTMCELFHGPSLSFKDFAAQFLMRLLDHLLTRDNERALILTATSGDTGGAVAAACHGRARIDAVICYPQGRISHLQEQQIASWGGNVHAVAVRGTFDDCQRIVKEMLHQADVAWRTGVGVGVAGAGRQNDHGSADKPLRHGGSSTRVTSANSINIGRLLPQTFYYWYAALAAPQSTFVVPSGNFGNLTAGVLAQRMGAPIAAFLAATNRNDTVPRYLATGDYHPHPTQATHSNAMDVSDPSNWERLRHLFRGLASSPPPAEPAEPPPHGSKARWVDSHELVRGNLPDNDSLPQLRAAITGLAIDEATTVETIRRVHAQHGYVLDPHTAVAWAASERASAAQAIILATAHPAKFPEVITTAIGQAPTPPTRLAACLHRPSHTTEIEATTEALRAYLTTTGIPPAQGNMQRI